MKFLQNVNFGLINKRTLRRNVEFLTHSLLNIFCIPTKEEETWNQTKFYKSNTLKIHILSD